MEPAVVAALVTAGASLAVTVTNTVMTRRNARAQGEVERELAAGDVLARYREPLVGAAIDLQSRLYNILEMSFLEDYATDGSDRQDVALKTTIFRVAQYLGWAELLRQDVQFLRFQRADETRAVAALMGDIREILNDDQLDERRFMLWRDEQRALGELIIDREAGRPRCLGYAAFHRCYEETFAPWCERLERDLLSAGASQSERLQLLQNGLCDLVVELDDDAVQYNAADLKRASARTAETA